MDDFEQNILWLAIIVFLFGVIFTATIMNFIFLESAKADAIICKQELANQTKACSDMATIMNGMYADCTLELPCVCGVDTVNGSFRVICQKQVFGNSSDSPYKIGDEE